MSVSIWNFSSYLALIPCLSWTAGECHLVEVTLSSLLMTICCPPFTVVGEWKLLDVPTASAALCISVKDMVSYASFWNAVCSFLRLNERRLCLRTKSISQTSSGICIHCTPVNNAVFIPRAPAYYDGDIFWLGEAHCSCICFCDQIVRCIDLEKLIYNRDVLCEHTFFDSTMRKSGLENEKCGRSCRCCIFIKKGNSHMTYPS